LGLTKATGWAGIPLDHPTYSLYAGLDVILTARLLPCLVAELDRLGVRDRLIRYEHEIARICAHMQRRGIVLDSDYVETLTTVLREDEARYSDVAASYGVANVNSTRQIAEALIAMGESLTETTDSGATKVDKAVLLGLADLDRDWKPLGTRDPNPLAEAVLRSKRAGKWCTTYADTFAETADADGRIHPFINSMQARTGRMSITRPALQTLPSSDWMIRRAMLAEPGEVWFSVDFQAIEMRVLAALADVKRMREGFQSGGADFDIHMYTAQLIKGLDATAKHRKIFKGAGFGKVYGGGVGTVARQTGADEDEIRRAFAEYDRVFPEIKRASARWQREAYQTGMVHVSVTGRRLPLDRHRAYAVVNYACQSAARDCLGQALINMEDAGLLEYLRLPIHDEVVGSVPQVEAAEIVKAIEDCMTFDLFGVPIVAGGEIGGRSWGSLYGADF
jgi:DNA polymerase-1